LRKEFVEHRFSPPNLISKIPRHKASAILCRASYRRYGAFFGRVNFELT
jgi:hypothetical protein